MKKIAVTLFAVVISISCLVAKPQIASFGLNTGLGQTKFKSTELGDVTSDLGFQLGGSLSIEFIPLLTVAAELQYINTHFEYEGFYDKVTNHNLSLPLVAGFSLFKIITLEAGPRFTLVDKSVITPNSGDKFKRNGDLYQDVGYLIGARIQLGKINVGARYNGQFGKQDSETFGEIGSHSYSISIGFHL